MEAVKIPVKYIDTRKYKVKIMQDLDSSDGPDTWGNYTIVQFRDNDFSNYGDLSDYLTELEYLKPEYHAKLRAGKMFTIDYRRYSSADGGHYRLDGGLPNKREPQDSSDINGFIIFEDEYIKGTTYEERRKYAEQDLKEYTEWAQGNVYGVIIEDQAGNEIDSCWGFIGDDSVQSYINSELADALPENVEITGVYPDGTEYETYISLEGGKQ